MDSEWKPLKSVSKPLVPEAGLDYLYQLEDKTNVQNISDNIRSIVLLADFRHCGSQGPPGTEQEIHDVLYGTGVVNPTVEELVTGCSRGTSTFHKQLRKIVTVPLRGCTAWNFTACPTNTEFAKYVEKQAISQGHDLSEFDYRWVVLDASQEHEGCKYAGLGTLGCWDFADDRLEPVCRIYISGENNYAKQPFVWLHELGHNLGLTHSSTPTSEYGDLTCAMGGWDKTPPVTKCYNLPHSVKLGWREIQYEVNGDDLYNVWENFTIKSFNSNGKTGLDINVDSDNLVIAFRSRYDKFNFTEVPQLDIGIDDVYGAIHIHQIKHIDPWSPTLIATLNDKMTYVDPAYSFVIKILRIRDNTAKLSICRKRKVTDCGELPSIPPF